MSHPPKLLSDNMLCGGDARHQHCLGRDSSSPSRPEESPLRNAIRRRGFTLIELLIVVVIIGVLASIAVSSFRTVKQKSYVSVLKSDLRNLAVAQEMHFESNRQYSDDLALIRFNPTRGVNLTLTATATGSEAIRSEERR